MAPDRHTIRTSACQQRLLPLHQTPSSRRDAIQPKASPVALLGRDRSMRVLRVIHGENSDTVAAQSFLPQQGGSFIHGSQHSLVQQLPKMQREARRRNPINPRKGGISISKYPTGNGWLLKAGANQSLTFLVLCSSAPPHWVKRP